MNVYVPTPRAYSSAIISHEAKKRAPLSARSLSLLLCPKIGAGHDDRCGTLLLPSNTTTTGASS